MCNEGTLKLREFGRDKKKGTLWCEVCGYKDNLGRSPR
jgi:hypothetical protein